MSAHILLASPIPTFVIDAEHIITHWNKACAGLTGIPASEMIGTAKQWLPFYSEAQPVLADFLLEGVPREVIVKHFGSNVRQSPLVDGGYEVENYFPDMLGKSRCFFCTAASLRDDKGNIIGAIQTLQDVTEKYNANKALQFTRFSINHANDMIYWVDPDGKIVDVNETTCKKLGWSRSELLSMTVMEINPSVTLQKFFEDWQNIKHQEKRREEASHYCKNGQAIPVVIHSNYIEFNGREYHCIFARDITERRELESLVTIQDKMGSLGRVAAGIAHEIRNPLSTINVYLSTLKRLMGEGDLDASNLTNITDALAEMDTASRKIETVVKRVMDFSKPSQHKMQLMNVNQCIRDAVDLSAVTLRKCGVSLEVQLDQYLPECYADSQLIEQLMLNLLTNAIEELHDSEGGRRLAVQTAVKRRTDGEECLLLTVGDSGRGVDPALRNKIFDPFFTTKHYGSGIGLSICHRIISDHCGSLHVTTSKWGGALFVAEFPVKRKGVS